MSKANDAAPVLHEYTVSGRAHRLVKGTIEGDWTPWTGVATLLYRDTRYYVVTDFFNGSLPTNTPFQVRT